MTQFLLLIISLILLGSLIALPLFAVYYLWNLVYLYFKKRNVSSTINERKTEFESDQSSKKSILFTQGGNPRAAFSEFLVARYLSTLSKDDYFVINELLIPATSNCKAKNSQIDHLVISKYGIFCIETKSHRGWIHCKKGSKTWTQILPHDSYEFYNPLLQNYSHTCSVGALLSDVLKAPIIPVVVFTDTDVILKKDIEDYANVGNIGYMLKCIESHQEVLYTNAECETMVAIMSKANQVDGQSSLDHVYDIANLISSRA